MATTNGNFFADVPLHLPEELFEPILKSGHVHIERIISRGHSTPAGQWFDQAQDEWIILLQGEAIIVYEHDVSITLKPGDYILIPAHTRHRVDWTAQNMDTLWLAIHL
jgi:cupin 2 domain-containing protein